MRLPPFIRVARPLGLLLAPLALLAAETTNRFGFSGPEIFPIDSFVTHLRAADLDADGRLDLVLVNNARSKINLLYNQTGGTNVPAPPPVRRELNQLLPDARFRIESIASEKRISALVVADLNADGRPDLAYFGEPKELVVHYHQGTNGWSAPKRIPLEDGVLDVNALASGDLNGDGLEDLVMLGENVASFLAQKPDHSLAEPERIPLSAPAKAVQILDLNGDGRQDLLLVNWDQASPLRFRLQDAAGRLGPELHFTLPPIRSYWADDLDGDGKTEVVVIAQKSGRAQVGGFVQQDAEPLLGGLRQGQFQVLPLNRTTKNRRGVTWADVNGDHLVDLLVAEPDSGQFSLHLQQSDGSLGAAQTFPTFTGVTDIVVADWDGDGKAEVFFLSSDERQLGVSRVEPGGRIPFPTIIPLEGRPLALAVGKLQTGGQPVLAVITELDGRRELVLRQSGGQMTRRPLDTAFKGTPSGLMFHDVNHDDRPDLVVLVPYEKLKVLLQTEDQGFDEYDVAPPGGSVEQPWAGAADVDGDGRDELLLAQKNFLRAVVAQVEPPPAGSTNKASLAFKVKEQINGATANSRIVAAAAVQNGTNQVLVLLDAERKGLSFCERDSAGVWQVARTVPLPVSDFTQLTAVGLGQPTPNAVALGGLNGLAWLPFQGRVWNWEEFDSYETPIKDGVLRDVVSGDLNQDGRKDLVFLETGRNHIDIVTFEPPRRLVPANRWQVFEERTFRNRRGDFPEPREAWVADFTGDGRNDLVVLVHDRLLLYPQE